MDDMQYDQLIGFLSRAIADVQSGAYRRVDDTHGSYSTTVYKVGEMVRVDIKVTPIHTGHQDACADITTEDNQNPPW